MKRFLSIIAVVASILGLRASAQPNFTLINTSLERTPIELVGFVDSSIEFKDASGKSSKLALDQILAIDRNSPAKTGSTPKDIWIAQLSDGSRLSGTPGALEGDRLRWKLQAGDRVADVVIDLARVISISRLEAFVESSNEPITQDIVRLKNGDVITGIIDSISDSTVSIQSNGKTIEANRDDILALRLADVSGASSTENVGYVLHLNDAGRSVLRVAKIVGAEKGQLSVAIGDQMIELDRSLIASMRSASGQAKFLVDLTPKSVENAGYFASAGQGPAFDDEPARSIQTRSRTVITYDVDGFRQLQTRFGIPSGLEHANVTVRIRLDGKMAFERANVVSGIESESITLDLNGAKQLQLETDFGENFDVQDRLTWLDPVLAR